MNIKRLFDKKSKKFRLASVVIIPLIALTIATGGFKILHDSKFEKSEYDANCHHNYGDTVSLSRCYLPYQFEGNTLDFALKLEVALAATTLVLTLIPAFT